MYLFSLWNFIFEGVIEFWAVTSALGLKKWHKHWSHGKNTRGKCTRVLPCPCFGSFLNALLSISMERQVVWCTKTSGGLKGWLPEWLGCLLGVLLLMWKVCVMCSTRSTSLTNTYGVESHHSNFSSHAYPSWPVTRVDVGGGCYRVVSEHGSTLGLDGKNVFFMHACRLYMCLLCMHGSGHCYTCVSM